MLDEYLKGLITIQILNEIRRYLAQSHACTPRFD